MTDNLPVVVANNDESVTRSVQKDVAAGGDVVGRDKITIYKREKPDTTLEALYLKYKKENRESSQLADFIEKLKHYTTDVDKKFIGLDKKLSDANLNAIVNAAFEYKEKFQKVLYSHQYSYAAQEIYCHFLAKAKCAFDLELPLISDQLEPLDKVEFVKEKIVNAIHAELGDNPLQLGIEEIFGLVFFLTGNCHISWK